MSRGDAVKRVLARVKGGRTQQGDGWMVCCPAHDDENPSCHIGQGRKGAVIKCFSGGCETEQIVSALGLKMEDLFDDATPARSRPVAAPPKRKAVSVKSLAKKFGHDPDWLREVASLRQIGGAVGVPYRSEAGDEMFVRKRILLEGKGQKYLHPKGVSLAAYGLHRLEEYRKGPAALMFVEGESDCWALWRIGVSAVGVPGSNATKVVEARHLQGIKTVYIHQEPGQAGEMFQLRLGERLASLGFRGPVRVFSMARSPGGGDPAGAFAELGEDRFKQELGRALKASTSWNGVSVDDMLIQMSSVDRKQMSFLWAPYLPQGMVTIAGGPPGCGKSFWTCELASAITAGRRLPGSDRDLEPGNVIMFAAEDDPSYTLRARLEDMGADLSKVFAVDLVNHPFEFGGPDLGKLETMIDRIQPRLVIFDPVVSFTGAKVNMSRQNEVRSALQPIINVAGSTNTTILLIAHVTKGRASLSSAIDGFMGSVDFTAGPRSALVFYPDPKVPEGVSGGMIAHIKHNNTSEGASLRYVIDDGRFMWRGEAGMSADEIHRNAGGMPSERSATEEAIQFLQRELEEGPVDSTTVLRRARSLGISESTLGRARMRLGVASKRVGFGPKARYQMFLPEEEVQEPEDEDPRVLDDDPPF